MAATHPYPSEEGESNKQPTPATPGRGEPQKLKHKFKTIQDDLILKMAQTILKQDIQRVINGSFTMTEDSITVEEPLDIRLQHGPPEKPSQQTVSITMRTPGNDRELALGFLFTEGIIRHPADVKMVIAEANGPNTVVVILKDGAIAQTISLQRNFYTTSSCGVCGKASIDSIRTVSVFENNPDQLRFSSDLIYSLAEKLAANQSLFERTGSLHAAALFAGDGSLHGLQEDVGRHNALDKLIGQAFLSEKLPLSTQILLLSGRISFELVQKAHMAGIKIITAVGAPSSLAVELATSNDITLIGFLRGNKFNLYTGAQRITNA